MKPLEQVRQVLEGVDDPLGLDEATDKALTAIQQIVLESIGEDEPEFQAIELKSINGNLTEESLDNFVEGMNNPIRSDARNSLRAELRKRWETK